MANESREHNLGSPRPSCGLSGPRRTRPIPTCVPHGPRKLRRCPRRHPFAPVRPTRAVQAPSAPGGGSRLLDGSGSTDQARRIKLNGGTPARPGGCRAEGHQHFLKGGAPAHPGRLLRGDRRHSRKHSSALEEATGARQRATAGAPEELYRPSGMPAAFRRPAACAQSTASPASLALTTRPHLAVGAYALPRRRLLGSVSAPAYFRLGARFVSAFAWFRGLLGSATPTLFR